VVEGHVPKHKAHRAESALEPGQSSVQHSVLLISVNWSLEVAHQA
jgi:hypothetical protein